MMFGIDDWILMSALGAGLGAITNKKDPLEGALIGGALGGVGGKFAPGLLNAGGATAGIAPGATAAEGAIGSGLLGAETGLNAAGYLAPEMSGIAAEQAAAPVVDMSSQAGMFDTMNYQTNGLLGKSTDFLNKAKPVMEAAQMGQQMAQANDPPPVPAPSIRSSPPDLNGILQQGYQQQQYIMDDAERRRRLMQSYAQNMGRM